MALLMKLVSLMKKYEYSLVKPIIIIEEPEQNLHPKVQSNLADMFYAIAQEKDFPIILETHSEYLVRKLQLIFADIIKNEKSDVETLNNEIKVYFFPEEGAPYSLNFRKNGRYENSFGPGFLDEASNLAFNLF
jgi:predicted ATPase